MCFFLKYFISVFIVSLYVLSLKLRLGCCETVGPELTNNPTFVSTDVRLHIFSDFSIPRDGYLSKITYMKTGSITKFCFGIWRFSKIENSKVKYFKTHGHCLESSAGTGLETIKLDIPLFVKENDIIGLDFFPDAVNNPISYTDSTNPNLKMYKVNGIFLFTKFVSELCKRELGCL